MLSWEADDKDKGEPNWNTEEAVRRFLRLQQVKNGPPEGDRAEEVKMVSSGEGLTAQQHRPHGGREQVDWLERRHRAQSVPKVGADVEHGHRGLDEGVEEAVVELGTARGYPGLSMARVPPCQDEPDPSEPESSSPLANSSAEDVSMTIGAWAATSALGSSPVLAKAEGGDVGMPFSIRSGTRRRDPTTNLSTHMGASSSC